MTLLAAETASKPRRASVVVSVAAAVAFVAIGVIVGRSLGPSTPGDRSVEAGFARDMIVHHAQAVEMAEIVRSRTLDEEIRTLATDIALTQQAQIGRFGGWLDAWGLPATGPESPMAWMGMPMDGPMPGMATADQVASLGELPIDEMDVTFLQLMIPHHQAALDMAGGLLERSDLASVAVLAHGIVESQQAEIDYMGELLAERGGRAPEGEPSGEHEGHASPDPASSTSVEPALSRVMGSLCGLQGLEPGTNSAERAFLGTTHDDLHAIADAVDEVDRSVAADLLETKAVVEAAVGDPSAARTFPRDVGALIESTAGALDRLGVTFVPCR